MDACGFYVLIPSALVVGVVAFHRLDIADLIVPVRRKVVYNQVAQRSAWVPSYF